jgi:hypothetical protein
MGHPLFKGNAPASTSEPECSLWVVMAEEKEKEERGVGGGAGEPCVKIKHFVEIHLSKKK